MSNRLNAKEFDAEMGNYYYGARYYDPKFSIWLSVDPLAEKYPGISPFACTLQNPVRFVDPTGMFVEDNIILNGKNGSSLTILAPGSDVKFNVDIDFGGNETKDLGICNLSDIAIGVQKAGSASGGLGYGGTASITKSNVMFFDEEYGGYWNEFIGVEGSADLGMNATISLSSEASLLIGIRNEDGTFGPEGFQGRYGFGSATVGGDFLLGADAFVQYSRGDDWSVFEFGVAGSIDMVPGPSAFGSGGFGTTRVMNQVKPTRERSWTDIITNQIFKNPFNPFINGN
ncbi:RHS repeat-associated core domain-containing protein [Aequorivita viscosa]|uniref:RHS repeat-associated core domain-containing protein n=1 Tax=Aequorivita viscosa TaxID=797419 RepID=UPI0021CDCEAB|nr:RHS repeat-associated core domain-containing protein [Aequorivita viscosa]